MTAEAGDNRSTEQAGSAVVLLYHRVGTPGVDPWSLCVTPEHFEQHLQILTRFHPSTVRSIAADLSNGKTCARRIALTFDDGYAETAAIAGALLEKYEMSATFYVPTGTIGSANEFWWDQLEALILNTPRLPVHLEIESPDLALSWDLGADPDLPARHALYFDLWRFCHGLNSSARARVLESLREWVGIEAPARPSHRCTTKDEVRVLAAKGFVDLGAHSVTHSSLARLSVDAQRAEIVESRSVLEAISLRRVDTFAYPFGKPVDYSDDTTALVCEAGFAAALVNDTGVIAPGCDPMRLPRLFVQNWNGARFAQELAMFLS